MARREPDPPQRSGHGAAAQQRPEPPGHGAQDTHPDDATADARTEAGRHASGDVERGDAVGGRREGHVGTEPNRADADRGHDGPGVRPPSRDVSGRVQNIPRVAEAPGPGDERTVAECLAALGRITDAGSLSQIARTATARCAQAEQAAKDAAKEKKPTNVRLP